MSLALTARERQGLLALIALAVAARLATLGAYPLMDSTESRYAEIARKMLETGDWLVPQFDYGVPFWGKPPLSTWLSAASMALLGVNEFAARLPSFIVIALTAALVYAMARLRGGRDQALWTLALFASTGLVFVSAGAVMTDPALVLGTTLSMSGFRIAIDGPDRWRRLAGYGFFAGLAVGMLAKGPVAVVLVVVPVGIATLASGSLHAAWRRLPWVSGLALAALASASWYWSAERASPGFLRYFLIGEHWNRFVEPGWSGDLYGTAHARPRGMIWLFWIAAALPWSIGAIGFLVRLATRERNRARALIADPWCIYLLLWAVTPMLFFTAAGNILITYVLPGLPAFVLLLGDIWRPGNEATSRSDGASDVRPALRRALVAGAFVPIVFVTVIVAMHRSFETERSQEALVRDYESARTSPQSRLVYFQQAPQSAEFYARGKVLEAANSEALRPYLDDATPEFLAIRARDYDMLSADDRAKLEPVGNYGDYRLLRTAPH